MKQQRLYVCYPRPSTQNLFFPLMIATQCLESFRKGMAFKPSIEVRCISPRIVWTTQGFSVFSSAVINMVYGEHVYIRDFTSSPFALVLFILSVMRQYSSFSFHPSNGLSVLLFFSVYRIFISVFFLSSSSFLPCH